MEPVGAQVTPDVKPERNMQIKYLSQRNQHNHASIRFPRSLLWLVVGCFADTVQFAVLLVILCSRRELLLLLVFQGAGISVLVSFPMSVPLLLLLPVHVSIPISVLVLIPVPLLFFVVMPVPVPVSVPVPVFLPFLFPLPFMGRGWWGPRVCTVRGMWRVGRMGGVRSRCLDSCCSSLSDSSSCFLLFFLEPGYITSQLLLRRTKETWCNIMSLSR